MKRRTFFKAVGASFTWFVLPEDVVLPSTKSESHLPWCPSVKKVLDEKVRHFTYVSKRDVWIYKFYYKRRVSKEMIAGINHDLDGLQCCSFRDTNYSYKYILHTVYGKLDGKPEDCMRITQCHPLCKGLLALHIDDGTGRILEILPGKPSRLLPEDTGH